MATLNDEIDLRPYFLTLRDNWRVIGALTILFGAIALVFTQIRPPTYKATANILFTRSRATLSLAEQFPTVSEPVDTRSRIDAILAIATSDAIAQAVLEQLGDRLSPEERQIESLKKRVELTSRGDVIQISVTVSSPGLAEDIANTWASVAIQRINQAFSGEQPLAEIQNQLEEARQDFELALSNLEDFLHQSELETLTAQIIELETLYDSIAGARIQRIQLLTSRRQSIENLLLQLDYLSNQIGGSAESNAGDVGDALAVLSARALPLSIVSASAQSPTKTIQTSIASMLSIQIPLNEIDTIRDSATNYAADLNAIAGFLNADLQEIELELSGLAEEVFASPEDPLSQRIVEESNLLRSRLEREQARFDDLSSEKDLKWNAYQALAQKEVEIENASRTENVVTLANFAVAPGEAEPRGTVFSTLIASGLGFFIGVFWAFLNQWWRTTDVSASGFGRSARNQSSE